MSTEVWDNTVEAFPEGREYSPFCFYCGRKLIRLVEASEEPKSHEPRGICPDCGTGWPRLYVDCQAPGCGNSFNHIYSPFTYIWNESGLYAEEAQGVAQCDACAGWTVYFWARVDSRVVRLRVSGFHGYVDIKDVRGTVHTDS